MTDLKIKTMIYVFRNKKQQVESLEQASKMYCDARDKSGQGASRFPEAIILDDNGNQTHHVSYNGKVWVGEKYIMGGGDKNVVAYNPYN